MTHLPAMHHSQRLDQRLHVLREEVRTMSQEKERGEQVWRERLQRCQRQLKVKEDEMSRQSQYFENFKSQLQQKLILARDREQSLQSRIYALEKQLLDMTVSAATGLTAVSAVRITSGTVKQWEERGRLPLMRGEGEGEEEKKEERRKQWQSAGENPEKKILESQNSNEARLQGFILSLQEDLRVLLEREEEGVTVQRGLTEQLQEAQENSHFLGCKVEGIKAQVNQLKQSESSLLEELEELREENQRLQQIIMKDAAKQTSSCSPAVCPVPSNNLSFSTATGRPSERSSAEEAAESKQTNTEDNSPSAKSETPPKEDPLELLCHRGPQTNPSLKSLSLTTETLDEFELGTWCSGGILNLEESPSEESDALRDAYRSLGFGEDLETLKEQRDSLEVALQRMQEQLRVAAQENTRLKSELWKEDKEEKAEEASREKVKLKTTDGAEGKAIITLAQDDLVQALNQENRVLAERIQELLAHIELREVEMKEEDTQLRDFISRLEADGVMLEQENQEQGGLITELTKKTEDDLNTIMELQQRLAESEKHPEESQVNKECSQISGCFQRHNLDESVVEIVLNGKEKACQESEDLITVLAPGNEQNNHFYVQQNSQQSSKSPNSLPDEVAQLSKSIQSLKTEQEELLSDLISLREQQREVALSIKTQTEEKQQLTRAVWGLKEEKDGVSQSLGAVKQEKEQLTRMVCGLRDERDQFMRSMSCLKEEKELLTKCLPSLKTEKETLLETLSSRKYERDQIMKAIQSLQTEREQLSQTVLGLKQERDEITVSLKCLMEQRNKEQSFYTLKEEQDKLINTVSALGEEKGRIEHTVNCLKEEENQLKLLLQGLREDRNSLQTTQHSQTQDERRNQKQHLMNLNSIFATKKAETHVGTGAPRSDEHRVTTMQELSDVMQEIEALGLQLKKSEDELDKSHLESQGLQSELHRSETRRQEAEIKAEQAAEKLKRLSDVANQIEETRNENHSLTNQVKELQIKLTVQIREKTEAHSLKTQIEEQYNVLTAQLRAKTAALEELNSEYIALKREQGTKDDVSAVLVSLRSRYNDIRAKYDALLKKRSQSDLDLAPLKAKLSCLVLKCQDRNCLLAQMMKLMHRHGCLDPVLSQQVEELLSDAALKEYSSAFTPRSNSRDYTTGFISKFQDLTSGFMPNSTSTLPSPANQQCQNKFPAESWECREINLGKLTSLVDVDLTTQYQACSGEVSPESTGRQESKTNSSVQQHASVLVTHSPVDASLKESLVTSTAQLYSSASGSVQRTKTPENLGLDIPDMMGKSSPDPSRLSRSSQSPIPLSSSPRVAASRRLSSPEKILNLQEQLQKTLMGSFQAPVSRGRGQQPRKCQSFSAPAADPGPASEIKKPTLSFSERRADPPRALSAAKSAPTVTNTPVAKKTLYNVVSSRSANLTFNPNTFTKHQFKEDGSKSRTAALSSSSKSLFASKSKSESTNNTTKSPKLAKKSAVIPEMTGAEDTVTTPITPRTTSLDSDVFICSDTKPKSTASDSTAPSISAAPEANHLNTPSVTYGAAPLNDGRVLTAHFSPERSNKTAIRSSAASEKTKTARPNPDAPAKVRTVDIIKTVGQSSLLIGWERPPLDELGCSNGTFVYGYRVFVDGDFHKSVMSSACTKCILENVDLSVPVHISVQTLGSNGLSSDSVNTTYRTSARTDKLTPD